MNDWHLRLALRALDQGGVLAYATEAVWGLGCDPDDEAAVTQILALKQRPWQKGLILVAASQAQVEAYLGARLSGVYADAARRYWPGHTSLVLPAAGAVPEWVRGEHPTVAVRVSTHPQVQALTAAFGKPLVSTSANPAGRAPAQSLIQVRRYFGNRVDYVLPGSLGGFSRPSQIIDPATETTLRM